MARPHTVQELMHTAIVVVRPEHTLRRASRLMVENDVGAAVVHGRVVAGILSERDVVRALADGANPDAERVSDVMTIDVVEVEPQASIADARASMVDGGIRHLLVRSDDRVVGILSARDLLAWSHEQAAAEGTEASDDGLSRRGGG